MGGGPNINLWGKKESRRRKRDRGTRDSTSPPLSRVSANVETGFMVSTIG